VSGLECRGRKCLSRTFAAMQTDLKADVADGAVLRHGVSLCSLHLGFEIEGHFVRLMFISHTMMLVHEIK